MGTWFGAAVTYTVRKQISQYLGNDSNNLNKRKKMLKFMSLDLQVFFLPFEMTFQWDCTVCK